MWRLVIACAFTACSFQHGQLPPADSDEATSIDAAVADARPQDFHLRVATLIDGESYLILWRDTARWQCNIFAAPGRWNGANEPTMLNDIAWYPTWPDVPTPENRDCMGQSSTFTGLPVPIPQVPSTVTLREIQTRREQLIIQAPAADNDWTLIVAITDYMVSGADDYIVEIDVLVN